MFLTFILLIFIDKVSAISIFDVMHIYNTSPYTNRITKRINGNYKVIQ